MRSRELVLDLLQSVVEIITYGDKHDPSILETVSGKINRDTLCLLVNVHGDVVVSFPLYTEALRFSHHEEKMIQTAVRTIALNIYNVSDEMVYKFIMTPPVSDYFSVMVGRLREMCIPLDAFLHEKRGYGHSKKKKLIDS
ncbi:protein TRANSPARENT TESTA 9 isoform X1 [Arachis hypogaea]|uniref:protein TRANSPARENT TESTA 9 isoform X1 n=1 Tax=Arachis hypogaea TaxID=3818 RepID=UPI000DEC201E